MKLAIKNRWNGSVIFEAEITVAADASDGVKLGLAVRAAIKADANLAGAYLARADLARANLAGAYLAGAYLARANLEGADLAGADLEGANLARANLARANLAGANLARAYLEGADLADADQTKYDVPIVENIDAKMLAAINGGGTLDMGMWHTCETTHCRAGWAIHLAGEKGYALEKLVGSQRAGAMIYHASRPGQPAPWFYDSNESALADIRKCAAEQAGS